MRTKLISLLLIAATLMTLLLTSCSNVDTEYEDNSTTIPAIKLTLYGIKGEGTTDEAIDLVEQQINRITEDKYKITVELKLQEESEYDDVIEDAFVSIQEQVERNELSERAATAAAKAAREAAKLLTTEEQKEKKRAQREYQKWAEANADSFGEINVEMKDDVQLDLFMVDDYDYFYELIDRELITDISAPVTGTYSIIGKYVSPIIMSVGRKAGTYYAIPVNRPLTAESNTGYQIAIKTDLIEKYGLKLQDDTPPTLNQMDKWFEQIKANEKCVVLLSPPEVIQSFDFYNNDMENYPAYGTKNYETKGTTSVELEYTFEMGEGLDAGVAFLHFKKMSKYRANGYFGEEGADPLTTDFAAAIFKGGEEDVRALLGDKADEYTYRVYSYPKVSTIDAFGSSFVVSSSCKYPERAVQLISGFCTVPELRNLITFGVENVHYEVNSDGKTITKISDDYNVGFESFGNSLIGYVPEELGADYQEKAKEKNMNIKVSAFLGYSSEIPEEDILAFEKINEVAREYVPLLMKGVVEVDAMLEEAKTKMGMKSDVLGVYPEGETGDAYMPAYNQLLSSLNGVFGTFAETRPGGVESVDNEILTDDEKKRREEAAKALEGETAEDVTEEVTDETVTDVPASETQE